MKIKSNVLKQKAALGAAATGAVFGLQQSADAAIVYTNPADIVASTNFANVGFDVDGDSVNDFRLRNFFNANTATQNLAVPLALVPYRGFFLANSQGYSVVKRFASGQNISAGVALIGGGSLGKTLRYRGTTSARGQFGTGQTGFAGIRLINGGQNYYGWIRLRVDDSDFNGLADKMTVFDFAYNDVANQSILAGEGAAAVPEPSRALLALAGLGTLALRRRRKTA